MPPFIRRALRFDSIEEVSREAETLLEQGYTRGGNWRLSQVALHLRDWLRYPIHGYPRMPLLLRPIMWTVRVTMGGRSLRKIIESGRMPQGGPTLPQTVHAATADESPAVNELKQAVDEWKNHRGPIHPSPVFGAWDYETATKLQLIHCAHHLSFLIPKG
jgi:hypothetical protein